MHRIFCSVCVATLLIFPAAQKGQVNVLTQRNDNSRSGQYTSEIVLNLTNVQPTRFGKAFSYAVDGQVYAQPLYVAGVFTNGNGRRNVVFIVTEHDSVYAFDADGMITTPLWHVNFLNPAAGVTSVPGGDLNQRQILPEIGITSTPVIDAAAGTIYVEAYTKEVSGSTASYVHRLHALNISGGAERPGSPVLIQSTVALPGGGNLSFDGSLYKNRTGLLLLNGIVYVAYAAHGDQGNYHGWVMGYDATTLAQTRVFVVTPTGLRAGIWQSGAGLVGDSSGNMFLMTGNGFFDGVSNYGQSFLKLSTGSALKVADYFTPFDWSSQNTIDGDVGSGGPMLLPDSAGSTAHPHLLVGAGKEGTIYLIDRDNMGHVQSGSDSQIVQAIPGALAGEMLGAPGYFNGLVYFGAERDRLKAYQISGAKLSSTPTSTTSSSFFYPGVQASISANGTSNGMIWAIENFGTSDELTPGTAVLHAINAGNLGNELYNSNSNSTRDTAGGYVKFAVPTVGQGRVYVGTSSGLAAYGLLTPSCATNVTPQLTITEGTLENVSPGVFQRRVVVTNAGATAISGPISYVLDNLNLGVSLVNGLRTTTCFAPTGSFYQSENLNGGSLQPGQKRSFFISFSTSEDSSQITYTPRVLSGPGIR